MMQGILSPWEKSILEVFRLYIIKIYIYSRMRCILQGILVYFHSPRPSFDTILMLNYWIGHCCKSFKKVLNFTKIRTLQLHIIYVKNTGTLSIFFSCMNFMTIWNGENWKIIVFLEMCFFFSESVNSTLNCLIS